MPPQSFRPLTRDQFAQVLQQFPFTRRIDAVHMHHTWKPSHSDYVGLETIVGMWRCHASSDFTCCTKLSCLFDVAVQ